MRWSISWLAPNIHDFQICCDWIYRSFWNLLRSKMEEGEFIFLVWLVIFHLRHVLWPRWSPRISGTSGSSTWGFAWPDLAWFGSIANIWGIWWPVIDEPHVSTPGWFPPPFLLSDQINSLKIALTLFLHIIWSRKLPKIWKYKSNPYFVRRKGMLSQPVFKAFKRVILWDQRFKIWPNKLWWCRPRGPCASYFTKQSFSDTLSDIFLSFLWLRAGPSAGLKVPS